MTTKDFETTSTKAGRKTIPEEYDLSMTDFFEIVHMAKNMNADGLFEPITTAYSGGFDAGMRYEAHRREGVSA